MSSLVKYLKKKSYFTICSGKTSFFLRKTVSINSVLSYICPFLVFHSRSCWSKIQTCQLSCMRTVRLALLHWPCYYFVRIGNQCVENEASADVPMGGKQLAVYRVWSCWVLVSKTVLTRSQSHSSLKGEGPRSVSSITLLNYLLRPSFIPLY